MKQALKMWILRKHPELLALRLAMQESIGAVCYERESCFSSEEARRLDQKIGFKVLGGPFRGMAYTENPICSEKWPKLVGSYEAELTELMERLLCKGFRRLIDVGCAEGFYAVGFAWRCPRIRVTAVDPLREAGQRLQRLASANGVQERIEFRRIVSTSTLGGLVDGSTLILMDCEGAELGLLKPIAQKPLQKAEIVVEVHDFVMPGMSEEIMARFAATHTCCVIEQERRDPRAYKCLASFEAPMQAKLLDEHRPGRLRWLHLAPRR